MLGVNDAAIHRHIKDAAAAPDELGRHAQPFPHLGSQTDRLRLVVSDATVSDGNLHGCVPAQRSTPESLTGGRPQREHCGVTAGALSCEGKSLFLRGAGPSRSPRRIGVAGVFGLGGAGWPPGRERRFLYPRAWPSLSAASRACEADGGGGRRVRVGERDRDGRRRGTATHPGDTDSPASPAQAARSHTGPGAVSLPP